MADLNFKNCSLGPKNSHFWAKKALEHIQTGQTRETVGTLHVCLDFPVSTSSLRPSNVPETAQKGPQKLQMPTATNQELAISLATWLKMQFHPQPPTFCGFHPSELPKRTPRPQYLGPLGCGKLQAQAQTGGCPNGSIGSSRGKKMTFLKNDPRPCVTLKQVFLDHFELVVAHFGPPKIPKCLENGLFWDQKWVKNGSKTHFSKPHPRPFGVHQRVK